MQPQLDEIKRREMSALAAIRDAFGTEADEYGGTLFVSHHLDELDATYWQSNLATTSPEPEQVLGLLELKSHWVTRMRTALMCSISLCLARSQITYLASDSMKQVPSRKFPWKAKRSMPILATDSDLL